MAFILLYSTSLLRTLLYMIKFSFYRVLHMQEKIRIKDFSPPPPGPPIRPLKLFLFRFFNILILKGSAHLYLV